MGKEHDSTVKFRPVDPLKVDKRWRKYRGFKIEADASEEGAVKSASFSMPVEKGLIKRVVAGEKRIAAIFTKEQEAFLREMAGTAPDLGTLSVLGPLRAQRWDFEDPVLSLADHGRTLESGRRRDADGGVGEGAGHPGRRCHGGLHGVSRRGRR